MMTLEGVDVRPEGLWRAVIRMRAAPDTTPRRSQPGVIRDTSLRTGGRALRKRTEDAVRLGRMNHLSDEHAQIIEVWRAEARAEIDGELEAAFERNLVGSQEAAGIWPLGQFRDLDRRRRFVWFRGFTNLAARAAILATFDGARAGTAHDDTLKDMLDEPDVLTLRATAAGLGLPKPHGPAPRMHPRGLVLTTIYPTEPDRIAGFDEFFQDTMAPILRDFGARILGTFTKQPEPSAVPAASPPAASDAFVSMAWFADVIAYESFAEYLTPALKGGRILRAGMDRHLVGHPVVWRLAPTARSRVPA